MPYIGQEAATTYSTRLAVQQFNGDGSTTAFTLNQSVSADQDILVSVDGVVQDTSAYTVSNGTTLTFSPAPSSGTANIFVNYLGLAVGTVTHPATQGLTATTGTFTSDISTSTLGTSNFRAGVNAGNSIASGGNYNTLIGDEAGTALTTGDDNVAIGFEALKTEDAHGRNVAVGYQSLKTLNAGALAVTTTVGYKSGTSLTTGVQNVLIGGLSGDALTDADFNVAVGNNTLSTDTQGSKSTAVGYEALTAQNFTSATDSNNTAVGFQAGASITTGIQNTIVGSVAGDAFTDADKNVAIGTNALSSSVQGSKNVAVGTAALFTSNPSGAVDTLNTAVGFEAGKATTTGTGNTFIGASAGDSCTDTVNCVAVGLNALGGADADHSNVAVGQLSLSSCTGDSNTAVGDQAGTDVTSGDNNSFLGQDAGRSGAPGGSITTASNTIVLGDGSIANAHIQVDWTVASDERDKTDFTALDLGLDFVKELEPVTYKWDKRSKYGEDVSTITHDGTHKEDWLDVGFKAQAVEALEEAAGYTIADKTNLTTNLSEDGKQYGIQYSKFVPILVKAIQELSEKVAALEAK